MAEIRVTIKDHKRGISLVVGRDVLDVFILICSKDPRSLRDFLFMLDIVRPGLGEEISSKASKFSSLSPLERANALIMDGEGNHIPFEIVDETSEMHSRMPAGEGVVLINIADKRIDVLSNEGDPVCRVGAAKVETKWGTEFRSYRLPPIWKLFNPDGTERDISEDISWHKAWYEMYMDFWERSMDRKREGEEIGDRNEVEIWEFVGRVFKRKAEMHERALEAAVR